MKILQRWFHVMAILFSMLVLESCFKDHDLEIVPPVLVTLPFEFKSPDFVFTIQAQELGNRKISEYGVVYTAYYRGIGDHNLFPTVDDNILPFQSALAEGLNHLIYTGDFLKGRSFIYYRTYAKVQGGPIVYGNRVTFSN